MLLKLQKQLQSLYLIQRLSWDQVQQLILYRQPQQLQVILEYHSGEHIPARDWIVCILYPTDGPDLHLDLHQCRICLFFPTYPTHSPSVVIDRPYHVETPYHGLYCFVEESLNGEESLEKIFQNSHIRNLIRILNKISSICPCHAPNMSTKIRLNLSITFWEILLADG